jgi:hypothetical protein
VIGLYELLGNPTTYLIEPPGPSAQICPCKVDIDFGNDIFKHVHHFTRRDENVM